MATTVLSRTGKALGHVAQLTTTSTKDVTAKPVKVRADPAIRLAEDRAYLDEPNVHAFLNGIALAEGGDYNLKYGGVREKGDKWQFTDDSTHPGIGVDGKTTAAGRYQINIDIWKDMGAKVGLTDFSPGTQDILAVEILRPIGAIDHLERGELPVALSLASKRWAALPQGPGKGGRYAQPSLSYEDFERHYTSHGGTLK